MVRLDGLLEGISCSSSGAKAVAARPDFVETETVAEKGTAKGLLVDFKGCFRMTGANRREEDHEEADAFRLATSPHNISRVFKGDGVD
jgi:uncharacterized ParB-like nuclease family protein